MLDINALWARAQELLPGLRCQCLTSGAKCVSCLSDGEDAAHEYYECEFCSSSPDLALLLRAMREAGFLYGLMPTKDGAHCWFKRYWLGKPNSADGPDELTAALQAAVAAMEA